MKRAALYAPPRSALSDREALIQTGIESAFAALADLELHPVGDDCRGGARPLPGLMHVNETMPIIALGRAAHVALSHVRKRTLVAEDLERAEPGGDDPSDDDLEAELETLLWSSVNTIKIVALGEPAWQSVQLLPVAIRRFYHVPPLHMAPTDLSQQGVLVVSHEESDARAAAVAEALDHAGLEVRCAGRLEADIRSPANGTWSNDAAIHVHVGSHTLGADELRLVDSWYSERLVVQLVDRSGSRPDAYSLAVDDNRNGFACETPDDLVAICRELLEDQVLQRKVIAVGQNTVAPLLKAWQAIAEDLLG